jgi:hypothetical protein
MRGSRLRGDGQSWSTFLRNRVTWACDFVQTFDIRFREVFVLFFLDLRRHSTALSRRAAAFTQFPFSVGFITTTGVLLEAWCARPSCGRDL